MTAPVARALAIYFPSCDVIYGIAVADSINHTFFVRGGVSLLHTLQNV